jgi:hypothetical protein
MKLGKTAPLITLTRAYQKATGHGPAIGSDHPALVLYRRAEHAANAAGCQRLSAQIQRGELYEQAREMMSEGRHDDARAVLVEAKQLERVEANAERTYLRAAEAHLGTMKLAHSLLTLQELQRDAGRVSVSALLQMFERSLAVYADDAEKRDTQEKPAGCSSVLSAHAGSNAPNRASDCRMLSLFVSETEGGA